MTGIRIGSRTIGEGQPCFLAAEIGINHNGDLGLAHDMIDAAADAGADGVKFQNYRTEDFLSDRILTFEYLNQGNRIVEPQYDLFKRCELQPGALRELKGHCDQRDVVFFSTPTSEEGVDDLVTIGAPVIKNGSDLLLHLPLIRVMARTGLPTILSTGMATLGDIDDAVRAFYQAGGVELVLLHCTSAYPTPDDDVHLRKIPALAAAFSCLVGFSDHTDGIVAAIGSRLLGACFIEKHFTLDNSLPGPDQRLSANPFEYQTLVESIRRLDRNLGSSAIGPAASEREGRENFRISCVAARDLDPGTVLTIADIAFRRPGNGLPPAAVDHLVSRRLARAVTKGALLSAEDFG